MIPDRAEAGCCSYFGVNGRVVIPNNLYEKKWGDDMTEFKLLDLHSRIPESVEEKDGWERIAMISP